MNKISLLACLQTCDNEFQSIKHYSFSTNIYGQRYTLYRQIKLEGEGEVTLTLKLDFCTGLHCKNQLCENDNLSLYILLTLCDYKKFSLS